MDKQGSSINENAERWWVATLIERFELDGEDINNMKRRCRAFTNTVILKASSSEEAYKKAIKYGESGIDGKNDWSDDKGRKGKWIFEGISSLLPIYDEIDPDGTEILFEDDVGITVGRVKSWVRDKTDLEVFS